MLRFKFLIVNLFILVLGYGQSNYLTDFNPDSLRFKTATAVRCSEPPVIDGVLDEPFWALVQPVTGFLQRDPVDGAPASEKTEVRIA